MRIERYAGSIGSFLATADTGEVFPCLVRDLQHGQEYHDPGIRRLPDGTTQARRPGGWGKLVHAERLVALLESSDTAVVSVNELNRQGKPHRAGYVGRFRYSDLRIDGEGIRLRLEEQVARAVNIRSRASRKSGAAEAATEAARALGGGDCGARTLPFSLQKSLGEVGERFATGSSE